MVTWMIFHYSFHIYNLVSITIFTMAFIAFAFSDPVIYHVKVNKQSQYLLVVFAECPMYYKTLVFQLGFKFR